SPLCPRREQQSEAASSAVSPVKQQRAAVRPWAGMSATDQSGTAVVEAAKPLATHCRHVQNLINLTVDKELIPLRRLCSQMGQARAPPAECQQAEAKLCAFYADQLCALSRMPPEEAAEVRQSCAIPKTDQWLMHVVELEERAVLQVVRNWTLLELVRLEKPRLLELLAELHTPETTVERCVRCYQLVQQYYHQFLEAPDTLVEVAYPSVASPCSTSPATPPQADQLMEGTPDDSDVGAGIGSGGGGGTGTSGGSAEADSVAAASLLAFGAGADSTGGGGSVRANAVDSPLRRSPEGGVSTSASVNSGSLPATPGPAGPQQANRSLSGTPPPASPRLPPFNIVHTNYPAPMTRSSSVESNIQNYVSRSAQHRQRKSTSDFPEQQVVGESAGVAYGHKWDTNKLFNIGAKCCVCSERILNHLAPRCHKRCTSNAGACSYHLAKDPRGQRDIVVTSSTAAAAAAAAAAASAGVARGGADSSSNPSSSNTPSTPRSPSQLAGGGGGGSGGGGGHSPQAPPSVTKGGGGGGFVFTFPPKFGGSGGGGGGGAPAKIQIMPDEESWSSSFGPEVSGDYTDGTAAGDLVKKWEIPFDELVIRELLGTGNFCSVHRGQWHGEVAVKFLRKPRDTASAEFDEEAGRAVLQTFKLDVKKAALTRHENLALFLGACLDPKNLCIVTALCKGHSLYHELREQPTSQARFTVTRCVAVAQQIVQGMGYLHARDIVHADLRSKNVFIEFMSNNAVKAVITDYALFNWTRMAEATRKGPACLQVPPGWLCYLAPELLRCLQGGMKTMHFSKETDVFAFGTLWYELMTKQWPYKRLAVEAIIWKAGNGIMQSLGDIGLPSNYKEIVLKCWTFEKTQRPQFADLFKLINNLPKIGRSPSFPVRFSKSHDNLA
uniref:Protein kinase domain-containing protein n=1 Tax=Macrostomum lignano TaxID=282301 RepID=A0A1I8HNQ1_9PLAT